MIILKIRVQIELLYDTQLYTPLPVPQSSV